MVGYAVLWQVSKDKITDHHTLNLPPPVDLLRTGDVGFMNKGIAARMAQLRNPDLPFEEKEPMVQELNDILAQAISICPHLVNGVEVVLNPDFKKIEKEKWGKYYGDFGYHVDNLIDAFKKKRGEFPGKFVLPLPYIHTRGGLREANKQVWIGTAREQARRQNKIPVVEVALAGLQLTSFFLDEVQGIWFVNNRTPETTTPYYVDRMGAQSKLEERQILLLTI